MHYAWLVSCIIYASATSHRGSAPVYAKFIQYMSTYIRAAYTRNIISRGLLKTRNYPFIRAGLVWNDPKRPYKLKWFMSYSNKPWLVSKLVLFPYKLLEIHFLDTQWDVLSRFCFAGELSWECSIGASRFTLTCFGWFGWGVTIEHFFGLFLTVFGQSWLKKVIKPTKNSFFSNRTREEPNNQKRLFPIEHALILFTRIPSGIQLASVVHTSLHQLAPISFPAEPIWVSFR